MTFFDRFDICEAYFVFAMHWHASGLCMHPQSGREINARLNRAKFRPRPNLDEKTLTENGLLILRRLERLERRGSKTPTPPWVRHLKAFHAKKAKP